MLSYFCFFKQKVSYLDCDSSESEKALCYCRFRVVDLEVTVLRQGMITFTAVFEYFPDEITVSRAGFVGYDCYQAMKRHQKLQYPKGFLLSLLPIQKNQVLRRQYEKNYLFSVLSFFVVLTVVKSKSKIRTVGQIHDWQYKRDKSRFLLPPRQ